MSLAGVDLKSDQHMAEVLLEVLENEAMAVCLYKPTDAQVTDLLYIYVNAAFQAMKPHAPMQGNTFSEVWPEIVEYVLPRMREVLETGESWRGVNEPLLVAEADGRVETHYYTFTVSKVVIGDVSYLVHTALDNTVAITARRESSRLLRVVSRMSDAVLAVDRQWKFTYANEKALAFLARPRDEVVGKGAFEVFPELEGSEWERQCRRALEERVNVTFEMYRPATDRWLEVRVYPTGEGIVLYYLDISIRKREEIAANRRMAAVNGINEILHSALTSSNEADLGLACVLVAEKVTQSPMGFISELREDGLLYDIAVHNPGWKACAAIDAVGHGPLRQKVPIIGLHGQIIVTGEPLLTNAPENHPSSAGTPGGHPPLESFLGVPLIYGGVTFGILCVANREGGYDLEAQSLLETLAPAIVESFERLRADQRQRRRSEFTVALNDISDAVHSTLVNEEIMKRVVVDVAGASGLNAIGVHIRGEEKWGFSYSYGFPEGLRQLRLTDEEAPMSMHVMQSGETLAIRSRADPRANAPLMQQFDIRALVGVPLVVRGEPFGVLFAGAIGVDCVISTDEVDFMVRVASTLSLALENARLYEGEHRIAQTLQEALLALPDRMPGIKFAHAYRSATDIAYVGGDFYDVFELEQNRIGVLIGDVAGKGLDAAVLTYLLKNTIRAYAGERASTPASVLKLTNDLVFKVTEPEMFATAFLAFIDRATGELVYSSAGHTTSVLIDETGELLQLAPNSPLMGAFANAEFRESHAVLSDDALLLIYTDGVIEARGKGGLYGEERLFSVAAASKGGDPSDIIRAVIEDVMEFASHRLSDDLAMLALCRLPREEAPSQQRLPVG